MSEFIETLDITVRAEEAKQRLDKYLASHFPHLTRTFLQNLITTKLVLLGESPIVNPSYAIKKGESYKILIPKPLDAVPQAQTIPLNIVYEDADLLVIDKPAGMVVHPAPGHHDQTLVNALLSHCGESLSGIGGVKRPGIVHRLDKDTSGLMVIAKNDLAHQGLSSQFANRSLSRTYQALAWGVPSPTQGTINAPLGRNPRNRQKIAVIQRGGKPAITHYHVLQHWGKAQDLHQHISLIECHLETGRTHQIRVHLHHIGHPIIGDPVYGRPPKSIKKLFNQEIYDFQRQALHATTLTFIHPRTKITMYFKSELPKDFCSLLKKLNSC